MNKPLMVILKWTLIGLFAGLLSGCTLSVARVFGGGDVVWANWQPLGAPPEKPDRIAGVGSANRGIFIVVGAHDKTYMCCDSGLGNWEAVPQDDATLKNLYGSGPGSYGRLGYEGAPGSYVVNTPGDTVATAASDNCAETCSGERHYVIRADGTVWTWGSDAGNIAISLSNILWLLGGLSGLMVGVVVTVVRNQIKL